MGQSIKYKCLHRDSLKVKVFFCKITLQFIVNLRSKLLFSQSCDIMDSTRVLQAASKKLCEKAETHIVFSIDKVTKSIKIIGDEKSVQLMGDDAPFMTRINEILQKARRQNESSEYKMDQKSRFHIFADIGSARWTGASRIRAQTSQILSLHGFGHKDSGSRLGEGDPPEGWPTPYVWARYRGPSTATISMNTQILLGIVHFGKAPVPDQQQVTFHFF